MAVTESIDEAHLARAVAGHQKAIAVLAEATSVSRAAWLGVADAETHLREVAAQLTRIPHPVLWWLYWYTSTPMAFLAEHLECRDDRVLQRLLPGPELTCPYCGHSSLLESRRHRWLWRKHHLMTRECLKVEPAEETP